MKKEKRNKLIKTRTLVTISQLFFHSINFTMYLDFENIGSITVPSNAFLIFFVTNKLKLK